MARAGRRLAVRLPAPGDPVRRPAPPAARPRGASEAAWTSSPHSSRRPVGGRWGCSRRCARPRQAAEEMRARLDVPVLCQGDDRTAELVRHFADEPATCLFGTLSLWQGVDVPGSACSWW